MQPKKSTLHKIAGSEPRNITNRLRRLLALVFLLGSLGASHKVAAQSGSINSDAITLTVQPTGQAAKTGQNYAGSQNRSPYDSYVRLGQSSQPSIAVPQLGTYDLNGNSSLIITGTSLVGSITTDNSTLAATRLQYRVYLSGTLDAQKPSYTNVTLNSTTTVVDPEFTRFSGSANTNIDLISGLTSGGTYVLDVRFQADASRTTANSNTRATFTDLSAGDYFLANFDITAPPTTPAGGTTIWQSTTATGGSTDWLLASNWSNGVPTPTSNAVIPAKSNSSIVYPVLNNPSLTYAVNNLTLQGNTGSSAAQLTINAATLTVYGNILQPSGGLKGNAINAPGVRDATRNSTIVLAGADQIITGQLLVADIIVAGSGVKSVINVLIPSNIIAFLPTDPAKGAIIQSAAYDDSNGTVTPVLNRTIFDTTGNSIINLVSTSSISLVSGEAETNTSYIKGVTRVDRTLTQGVQNKFGNIGLDVTANHTPGNIFVYRVVGDPLTGPLAAGAVPTKRYYQVVGDDNSSSAATAGSNLDIVFHYLDSSDELNGIKEENLNLFTAQQNGAPFRRAYGTLDTGKNTVIRLALPSAPNFYLTLGDVTNPLPVTLTAFAAVRSGANALVSWTTASELNNKGFNVQVSADGVSFRSLGFVASKMINSSQVLNYTYTDTEAGKSGNRYYRLEQVDLDGKVNYSAVRVVGFSGETVTSAVALVAYPNPFTTTLEMNLEGASVSNGALVSVRIMDMTGRIVRDKQIAINGASLSLGDLSDLRSGLYMAKVTLPDGSAKTVRIQRQ
ncbi:MAG: T9SS type A sorting domain-containing protein [Hymenobacter sp.]|nr:MAG: T9SS type A sorting domain-containing protein [Hymenobacter sp.]